MNELLTGLIGLIGGGGLGAFLLQLYNASANRKKIEMEASDMETDVESKRQTNYNDHFDVFRSQLNTLMQDYIKLQQEMNARIQEKNDALAKMSCEMMYLRNLRCYDTLCVKRVTHCPDRTPESNEQKPDDPEGMKQ